MVLMIVLLVGLRAQIVQRRVSPAPMSNAIQNSSVVWSTASTISSMSGRIHDSSAVTPTRAVTIRPG
jgi:hypothetical protein